MSYKNTSIKIIKFGLTCLGYLIKLLFIKYSYLLLSFFFIANKGCIVVIFEILPEDKNFFFLNPQSIF